MEKTKGRIKPLKEYDDDLKIELGWALLDSGRYEEGLALYNSLSWITHGETKVTGMVRGLIGIGDYKEASRLLKRGLRKYPNSYSLWIAMGSLYEGLGDDFKSLECFEIALRFAPEDNSAGFYNKALALMRLGLYGDAISILDNLINKFPEEARYFTDRGWCALDMGYPEEALQYLQKALETWPHSQGVYEGIRIYVGLYQAYRELKMLNEAMGIALEGLKKFPDEEPVIYQNLAEAFLTNGLPHEAIQILKTGIEKFPEDQELKEFLKQVEEYIDDPDGGENPTLLGLLLLAIIICKRLRERRF